MPFPRLARFLPAIALTLVATVAYFVHKSVGTYDPISRFWGISTHVYFADLQILLCGIDAFREGLNPYEVPCLYEKPYFNYPISWQIFSIFPWISNINVVPIGIVIYTLFAFGVTVFLGKTNWRNAIISTAFCLSPSVMLGLERGNNDIPILAIFLFISRLKYINNVLIISILMTSFLKLFPIGGLLTIAKKPTWKLLLVGLIFLCFVLLFRDNLLLVSNQTPRPFNKGAFGFFTLPDLYFFYLGNDHFWYDYFAYLLILISLFWILFSWKKTNLPITPDFAGKMYLLGVGIFSVAWCIGNNFEYRLAFLILTLPLLYIWLDTHPKSAIILLVLTFLSVEGMYFSSAARRLFGWNEYHALTKMFVNFLFLFHAAVVVKFMRQQSFSIR